MGIEDNCEYVYQSNTHTYGCIHCIHTEPSDLSITPSDRVVASKPHWIYLCPLPTVWGSLAHMTTSHISECQEFELKSSHWCSRSSCSMTHHPSPWHCLCVSSKGHWLGTENATQWQSTYKHNPNTTREGGYQLPIKMRLLSVSFRSTSS